MADLEEVSVSWVNSGFRIYNSNSFEKSWEQPLLWSSVDGSIYDTERAFL
jgi:hypothetical protein